MVLHLGESCQSQRVCRGFGAGEGGVKHPSCQACCCWLSSQYHAVSDAFGGVSSASGHCNGDAGGRCPPPCPGQAFCHHRGCVQIGCPHGACDTRVVPWCLSVPFSSAQTLRVPSSRSPWVPPPQNPTLSHRSGPSCWPWAQ